MVHASSRAINRVLSHAKSEPDAGHPSRAHPMSTPLVINPKITIPANELTWTAARASGPGGQNVNKVASKVELRFDLSHTTVLDAETRGRLRALAGNRLDADGCVRIVSQATRDQFRNLEDAREKLRDLVLRALVRPVSRRPTKPSRASKARRLDEKRRQGDKKRDRRARDD
jgi:ribosome-associated protein